MSRRDSKANADRIVEALQRLWEEHGAPSTEQIAAEAGLGVATVYRHYPNRAELERAAFSQIHHEQIKPLLAGIEDASGADLVDLADRFIEVVGRYSPLLSSLGADAFADEMIDDTGAMFVDMLRRGQEQGFLRTDLEPSDIYWVIRMLVLGLNSPLASEGIRRRFLALTISAIQPGSEGQLPPYSAQDYANLAVPPEHRRPPFES